VHLVERRLVALANRRRTPTPTRFVVRSRRLTTHCSYAYGPSRLSWVGVGARASLGACLGSLGCEDRARELGFGPREAIRLVEPRRGGDCEEAHGCAGPAGTALARQQPVSIQRTCRRRETVRAPLSTLDAETPAEQAACARKRVPLCSASLPRRYHLAPTPVHAEPRAAARMCCTSRRGRASRLERGARAWGSSVGLARQPRRLPKSAQVLGWSARQG
jgi:hypothetical protein